MYERVRLTFQVCSECDRRSSSASRVFGGFVRRVVTFVNFTTPCLQDPIVNPLGVEVHASYDLSALSVTRFQTIRLSIANDICR